MINGVQYIYYCNINRNVQEVPQSQAAANPQHQEEKKDKNQQVQNKQTNARKAVFPKRGDHNAKMTEKKKKTKKKNTKTKSN